MVSSLITQRRGHNTCSLKSSKQQRKMMEELSVSGFLWKPLNTSEQDKHYKIWSSWKMVYICVLMIDKWFWELHHILACHQHWQNVNNIFNYETVVMMQRSVMFTGTVVPNAKMRRVIMMMVMIIVIMTMQIMKMRFSRHHI